MTPSPLTSYDERLCFAPPFAGETASNCGEHLSGQGLHFGRKSRMSNVQKGGAKRESA